MKSKTKNKNKRINKNRSKSSEDWKGNLKESPIQFQIEEIHKLMS